MAKGPRFSVGPTPLTLCLLLASCHSGYMRDAVPQGPPGPDESKVIFYRTSLAGAAAPYPIFHGDQLVGLTEKGHYFEVRCSPGWHVFSTGYGNSIGVEADLSAGKTYYVQSHLTSFNLFESGAGLTPITRGTSAWNTVEKKLRHLQCRELDPDQSAEAQEYWKQFGCGISEDCRSPETASLQLRPEDGR